MSSEWNSQLAKLYSEFTEWLKGRGECIDSYIEDAKTYATFGWYKSGADIELKDKDKYNKELFSTESIQSGYKEYLYGSGLTGDPIVQRFQAGHIMADETAFYLRHAPISELLACGYMQGVNYKFTEELYKKYIQTMLDATEASKNTLKAQN